MQFTKRRLIIVALFLLAFIILNAIPSKLKQQTVDENAQVANGPCTEQHFGFPFPLYSKFGGGGFISPMTLLATEATPVFSEVHIVGLIMDIVLFLACVFLLLWIRMPGLMGEGQENIAIVRDADREEQESDNV
ncbi:MAG TPA: hypothetical protein VFE47_15460 [Tepidisphaeraceae bacterium]|nr:hypothetical protein [Tepidisphaeraceae bacterium]